MDIIPNDILRIIIKYTMLEDDDDIVYFPLQIIYVCKRWYAILEKWNLTVEKSYNGENIIRCDGLIYRPSLLYYLLPQVQINATSIVEWYALNYPKYFNTTCEQIINNSDKIPKYFSILSKYIDWSDIVTTNIDYTSQEAYAYLANTYASIAIRNDLPDLLEHILDWQVTDDWCYYLDIPHLLSESYKKGKKGMYKMIMKWLSDYAKL